MEYLFGILLALFVILGPWIFILIQSSNLKALSRRVDALQLFLNSQRQQSQPNEVPSPKDFQRSSFNEVLSTEFSQQSSVNEVPSTEGFVNEVPSPNVSQRSSKEWEMFVGGKLLNRIGAIAIVLGVLFFLKYAFDENWITEPMRVGIGIVAGAALLVAAARFHKRELVVFAQGLIGAGFPVLYLSVWSTYSYYHILPHTASFVCMMLVTVLAAWHAIRYRSLFIGLMTVIGGMLTPALLSTGEMNTTGLFTYLILLDLGLYALVIVWRMWKSIGWLTLVGTLFWWLLWLAESSNSSMISEFPAPIFFALLFIGMMIAYDVMAHQDGNGSVEIAQRLGIATLLFAQTAIMYSVLDHFALPSWIISFWIETLLLVAAVVVLHRLSLASSKMKAMYSSFAVLCFALVPAHADVSSVEVALFRGLIAAACVLAFRPFRSITSTVTAGALAAVSLITIFYQFSAWSMDGSYEYILPWNGLPFALLACGIGLYTCGFVIRNSERNELRVLSRILQTSAWLTVSITVAKQSFDISYNWLYSDTTVGIQWQEYISGVSSVMGAVLVGLVLRTVGELRRNVSVSIAGALTMWVGVLLWLLACIPFAPDSHFFPGLNIRVITALFFIAGLYLSVRTTKQKALFTPNVWNISFWLSIGLLSFVMLSAEAVWPLSIDMRSAYSQDAPNVGADILDKIHLVLSTVWIVYSILVVAIGFLRKRTAVRITGISLLGVSILKIFIYDLSFLEQPYRIVSFIALGLILLLASFGYQRFKHIILT